MTSRTRAAVLAVSLPVLAFAVIGGFLGREAAAQGESYRALRIFEDVVTLIINNYVEDVDVDKVMHGAMHGLADGLDPDSAYLDAQQMKTVDAPTVGLADPGLALTRQYYLRVVAARDGSAAAKAGLRPGDYVRSIDGQSTRDTTVFEGMRLLRGKAGTKVRLAILRGTAAEPHELELVREPQPALAIKGRVRPAGTGYLRVGSDCFLNVTGDACTSRFPHLLNGTASHDLANILNFYPPDNVAATVGRFGMCLTLAMGYPLGTFVGRLTLRTLFNKNRDFSRPVHALVTTAWVALTLVLAVSVSSIGVVFNIVGAIAGSSFMITLPGILVVQTFRHSWVGIIGGISLSVFGAAAGIIAVVSKYV